MPIQQYLKKYGQEKNSEINSLSNSEIKEIYKEDIINSNNYDEIKKYYINLDKQFLYNDEINLIVNKYDEINNKLSLTDSVIQDNITELSNNLKNPSTDKTTKYVLNNLDSTLELCDFIIENDENSINEKEEIINDFIELGKLYENLIELMSKYEEEYDVEYENIENSIIETKDYINNNSDLKDDFVDKLMLLSEEYNKKYTESENPSKCFNYIMAKYSCMYTKKIMKYIVDEYIEANPVTISYSNTSEWTNEDVVATLNIGKDSKVTNNNGNNTYTFNKNGTFTFEYERRGQVYKLEAKATNIDKEAPTIKGVEDGKIYINSAKPIIEDENISSIFIRFNDTTIAYYEGIILQDEGTYNITAMDKAGNTSVMEFYVVDENPDGYIINNNYIQNVWQKTTVKEFKEEFRLNANYTIKRSGSELHENDYVATGDTIELSAGISYTIVVAGDINNDGKVTVYDLSKLRRYILKQEEFNEIQLLAADINVDNQDIGVKDYSRMRIEILGRY